MPFVTTSVADDRRRPRRTWLGSAWLITLATSAYALWLTLTSAALWAAVVTRPGEWLTDFAVYDSGARDFLDHTLYRHPLSDLGLKLSAPIFKLPPFAALTAVPLAWLDPRVAGFAWCLLGVAAVAAGTYVASRVLGFGPPWFWTGIMLAVFAMTPTYAFIVIWGNLNPLVFAGIAVFALLHLCGRQRSSGLLLGLMVATKLWPLPLLVVVVRERRWIELRWAAGFLVVQAVFILTWLGVGAIGPMISTAQTTLPGSATWVTYVSWLALNLSWWPSWGGVAVALALIAVPARGRAGLGLGVLAGLALVIHLWWHYFPVLALGFALVAVDIAGEWRRRRIARHAVSGIPA